MRQMFLAGTVCALLIGCSKQSGDTTQASNTETSRRADVQVSTKDEKKEIDSAAKEAQRQVTEASKAQKERIEAEAKAAKAEIDANKAEAQAAVKQQQKNLDEQSRRIESAVGSAQQSISETVPSEQQLRTASARDDEMLMRQMRDVTGQNKSLDISVNAGTVTLRGTVNSQQEKDDLEKR